METLLHDIPHNNIRPVQVTSRKGKEWLIAHQIKVQSPCISSCQYSNSKPTSVQIRKNAQKYLWPACCREIYFQSCNIGTKNHWGNYSAFAFDDHKETLHSLFSCRLWMRTITPYSRCKIEKLSASSQFNAKKHMSRHQKFNLQINAIFWFVCSRDT